MRISAPPGPFCFDAHSALRCTSGAVTAGRLDLGMPCASGVIFAGYSILRMLHCLGTGVVAVAPLAWILRAPL